MRRSISAAMATLAAIALATTAPPTAAARLRPGARVEKHVHSDAPDATEVSESYVRLYEPLPDSAGPHPKRCDWIAYLRFRSSRGPERAFDADAIFVSMPGIFAGAAMHDQLARNVVRRGHEHGKAVEYWALDRRSNCLEDHQGVQAGANSHDAGRAFGYYWGGQQVHGHSFEGFKTSSQTQFLDEVGLEQTMRDEYAVIKRGVPSLQARQSKVFCGGHSLGGPLTTAFAGWDFDGDPETRHDAGYRQCAGFFGLDTTLGFDSSGGSSSIGIADALAQASGGSPYVNAPPFTPETIQLLGPLGVGAYFHPRATNLIGQIPHTPNIDLSQRVLFSRNAVNFLTGTPSIRDFNLTNETVLAGIFDDNSEPVTILRTSLGTVAGGPLAKKEFPTPGGLGFSVPLVNNDFLLIPSEPHGPLYRWRNYSGVDPDGESVPIDDPGRPYTSAKSEVADIHQFARQLFEAPADWAEQYFPTRLLTDLSAAEGGDRSGSLRHLLYDGIAKRPAFIIDAGDSDANTGPAPQAGSAESAPNDHRLSGIVVLPGYNHVDVVNAAWKQRGGKPERSSRTLLDFGVEVVAAHRHPHRH